MISRRDDIYIYTYSGEGARWYQPSATSPDGAVALDGSPSEYLEVVGLNVITHTDRGLLMFRSADGRYCCLVHGIDTGKSAGNVSVKHHVLLTSESASFSRLQRQLAILFVDHAPIFDVEGEFRIDELAGHIVATRDGAIVNWDGIRSVIESAHQLDSPPGIAVGGYARPDSNEARQELLSYVLLLKEVDPRTIVVAVVPRRIPASVLESGPDFHLYSAATSEAPRTTAGSSREEAAKLLFSLVRENIGDMRSNAKSEWERDFSDALEVIWRRGDLGALKDRTDRMESKLMPTQQIGARFLNAWGCLTVNLLGIVAEPHTHPPRDATASERDGKGHGWDLRKVINERSEIVDWFSRWLSRRP